MRAFRNPPLPFMGNKRNQLKNIKQVLHTMQEDGQITKDTIFIDVFGGSGLVSHTIKSLYPNNRVIWNDFDNYAERLAHIDETEALRQKCLEIVQGQESGLSTKEKRKRGSWKPPLTQEQSSQIIQLLESAPYVDITTLSSYLMFGGDFARDKAGLLRNVKYDRISTKPLDSQGYLEGVERVSLDFRELLKGLDTDTRKNALLILDPPYLQTKSEHYKGRFRLNDFFDLLELMTKPYIFFSSENSDILACFEKLQASFPALSGYSFDYAHLHAGLWVKDRIEAKKDYILYPSARSLFA